MKLKKAVIDKLAHFNGRPGVALDLARRTLRMIGPKGSRWAVLENGERSATPESNATPAVLADVNAMPQVGVPRTPENVYIRYLWGINDAPLKNGMRLDTDTVRQLVDLARGVGIQANHDLGDFTSGVHALPLGRLFGARVELKDNVTWGVFSAMYPKTAQTTEIIERADGGAIAEQSVQFVFKMVRCNICNTDWSECAHWAGEEYDGRLCEPLVMGAEEFLEISHVWAGMANGTHMTMGRANFEMVEPEGRLARYFVSNGEAKDVTAPDLSRFTAAKK